MQVAVFGFKATSLDDLFSAFGLLAVGCAAAALFGGHDHNCGIPDWGLSIHERLTVDYERLPIARLDVDGSVSIEYDFSSTHVVLENRYAFLTEYLKLLVLLMESHKYNPSALLVSPPSLEGHDGCCVGWAVDIQAPLRINIEG